MERKINTDYPGISLEELSSYDYIHKEGNYKTTVAYCSGIFHSEYAGVNGCMVTLRLILGKDNRKELLKLLNKHNNKIPREIIWDKKLIASVFVHEDNIPSKGDVVAVNVTWKVKKDTEQVQLFVIENSLRRLDPIEAEKFSVDIEEEDSKETIQEESVIITQIQ